MHSNYRAMCGAGAGERRKFDPSGMGLEADTGNIFKIAGDTGGCDDDSDASVDGSMRIEGDTGGGDGEYGESGTSGPDGMDLDLSGRDACGSDGEGGEDDSMGLEADAGAASEVEEGIDGAGDAAAPAAAIAAIGHGVSEGAAPVVATDGSGRRRRTRRGNARHRTPGDQRPGKSGGRTVS